MAENQPASRPGALAGGNASSTKGLEGNATDREPVREATLDSVAGEEDPGASLDLVMPATTALSGASGQKKKD